MTENIFMRSSAVIITVTTVLGIGYTVAKYATDFEAAKEEIQNLRGQIVQLQNILEKAQDSSVSGIRGEKGEKGDPGLPGPQGERGPKGADGADFDSSALNELRVKISALEKNLAGNISERNPSSSALVADTPDLTSQSHGDFKGIWRGNVSCETLGFATTLTITGENDGVGTGSWNWSGSNSGRAKATLSPSPVRDEPSRYILVTDGSAFDYHVGIVGNIITGKSIGNDCDLHLER